VLKRGTRQKQRLEREREANAKLREALESIAANHTPAFTDIAYWLSVGQHECAETLANDTQIARKALLAAKQDETS
jgi:ribosomal protein L9